MPPGWRPGWGTRPVLLPSGEGGSARSSSRERAGPGLGRRPPVGGSAAGPAGIGVATSPRPVCARVCLTISVLCLAAAVEAGAAGRVSLSGNDCGPIVSALGPDGAHPSSVSVSVIGQSEPHQACGWTAHLRHVRRPAPFPMRGGSTRRDARRPTASGSTRCPRARSPGPVPRSRGPGPRSRSRTSRSTHWIPAPGFHSPKRTRNSLADLRGIRSRPAAFAAVRVHRPRTLQRALLELAGSAGGRPPLRDRTPHADLLRLVPAVPGRPLDVGRDPGSIRALRAAVPRPALARSSSGGLD